MCILSRPLRSGEVLRNFGGKKRNDLNSFLSSDEINTDMDLSSNSPYVTLDFLPTYLNDMKNDLSIFSLNVQSLNAKYDKLKVVLDNWATDHNFNFSILNFQESWLAADSQGDVDTSNLELNGYSAFATGAKCSTHGGVISYVKESLQAEVKLKFNSRFWDAIFLYIKGDGIKPFLLGNIYRAPKTDNASIEGFMQEILPILQTFNKGYKNITLCGDINLDLIKANTRHKTSEFLDSMLSMAFCPKITLPTRFAKYTASLLDLIFVKNSPDIDHTTSKNGILYSAISDHFGCFTVARNQKPRQKHITHVNIETNDEKSINAFSNALSTSDLMSKINNDIFGDPRVTYNIINAEINEKIKEFLPTRKVKFNKYKHKKSAWISNGLLHSIRTRDNLYRRWKSKDQNSLDYLILKGSFEFYSEYTNKAIKQAKILYYQKEFEKFKGDIKRTWKTINTILNRNRKVNNFPSHIICKSGKLENLQDIVNEFNDYFCNIGQELAKKIPSSKQNYSVFLKKQITSSFSFNTVDSDTIKKVLNGFKPKTSKGTDGISMKLLKSISQIIIEPLRILVNQSIMTSTFPSELKLAKILPLIKTPNNFNIDNFRPISLLPSISKIIEKCVFLQIYEYFERYKLLYDSQYGYRKNHSTETACLELVDKLFQQLDEGKSPFCVFIDLSKAFDTIDHKILLTKLKYYGLDNKAVNWFQSYLSGRKQYVEIEGHKSSVKDINTGVPQGSTLGPLLFIIYMNDINDVSPLLKTILFADDTSLSSVISLFPSGPRRTSLAINNELEKITDWLRANKLSLNVKKTKYMVFRFSQTQENSLPKLNLKMNGVNIAKVTTFKFLGITISETLSWKPHLDIISKKISKVTGVMNRIKYQVNSSILQTIYNSLILSHLHYGILCWGFYGNRLFKLQKKAVRVVDKQKYNAHTDPIFKRLKLLKIEDIFKVQCLKFYFKLKNKSLPSYFVSNFILTRSGDLHEYHLRSNNYRSEAVRRHSTNKRIRLFLPTLLNGTPNELLGKVSTHSLDSFKRRSKNLYLDSYSDGCTKDRCYICSR